jgi:hypothetical protein
MNIRDPTGKLARWSIYLQQYDYTIIHRKGRKHSNVDTLSRPVLVLQVNSTSSADSPTLPSYLSDVDPHEDEALLLYLQFGRHLNGQSKKRDARMSCFAQSTINIKMINYGTAKTSPQTIILRFPKDNNVTT